MLGKMRHIIVSGVLALLASSLIGNAQDADKIVIPAGTKFKTLLETPVSSKLVEVGDSLLVTVAEPVKIDGKVVLPRGLEMTGKVTYIKRAGKISGRAEVYALINELNTHYGTEAIAVSIDAADDAANDEKVRTDEEGKLKANRDGAGDVDKALKGAGLGSLVSLPVAIATQSAAAAVAGPAAGALAAILLTRGKEIRLPVGTLFRMKFDKDLVLPASVASVPAK
jgi:hypothetical protein